uniref:Uncharacterized protein n=1 Tax=Lotharella oceanica TaxID=641309 RepID=A0A7S2U5D8_9EUKA|mmetsp:Transcript_9592/g.18614  ORF Transcript_9592/g.18614 Transcript_9592/m.18614 type:complete len:174 (+) Transcript_9592:96-617(+)
MGCNSTRQADIAQDRKRIKREHESRQAPARPTPSLPRGIARPVPKESAATAQTYGSSYTEKHLLERDFMLENIVKRNQNKFIDVSMQLTPLDEKEAVDRVQKYSRIKLPIGNVKENTLPKPVEGDIKTITSILCDKEFRLKEKLISDFGAMIKLLKDMDNDRVEEKTLITVSW